ncbi:YggT family protein [Nicoletella semolina]|uniref:YggT family protein n=1 Tax=Nicoletella semolina TaxID=271160 RepID=A0A4R2N8R0_9PAST|nr:YggT family protein [Nicoletella semolina]MDH2924498.1 hypothetical protein [Nicoletella semolina]TCP17374.1 YggT family protein [Nicoletella semolina]
MSEILLPIVSIIVGFITFILILRTWLEFCRVDPRLPISQSLIRMTSPLISPLQRVISNFKRINFAALLLALILLTVEKLLLNLPLTVAILVGLLGIMKTFGQILFFTTIIRALMSWITQGNHPLDYTVAQITEPVLGLIRRILPRTGMLDLSVMVFGITLILLNNLFYKLFGLLWVIA